MLVFRQIVSDQTWKIFACNQTLEINTRAKASLKFKNTEQKNHTSDKFCKKIIAHEVH